MQSRLRDAATTYTNLIRIHAAVLIAEIPKDQTAMFTNTLEVGPIPWFPMLDAERDLENTNDESN